ncbi:MAG: type II toxin-antitoxin system RelB/DinJ family antitoxin [Clostridiales bacterium]|jgi:DNA-damage-inducible protein J|nr:type II toxin-antitoxin system RelB/DinJ family antitoxin [Clostridiales bacterium]
MTKTSMTLDIDSDLKEQTEELLQDMGLDMSTAVTLFAKAVVRQQRIPFEVVASNRAYYDFNRKKALEPDSMAGKIWIADDFDAPLDEFKEYM